MKVRVMSQGMYRLFDAFAEAEYGRGRYERGVPDVEKPRQRLFDAIVSLEARNAVLEDENAQLRKFIEQKGDSAMRIGVTLIGTDRAS